MDESERGEAEDGVVPDAARAAVDAGVLTAVDAPPARREWRRAPRPFQCLTLHEQLQIIDLANQKKSCEYIADMLGNGRTRQTVWRYLKRLADTTELATKEIRAKAVILARRVVRDADVQQAINVLERPNVGVLEPVKTGARTLIAVSVAPGSCGAVADEIPSGAAVHVAVSEEP